MKALELSAHIDDQGNIQLASPLRIANRDVKTIVLIPENEDFDDETWLRGISSNPAFDFLNDPGENIYSTNDGSPITQ